MCRGFTFEEAQAAAEQLDVTQRKSAEPFKKGDHAEFFSKAQKEWMDAEIVDVVGEGQHFSQLKAGSIKVSYDCGTRCQWLAPQEADSLLRPSSRPQPPASMKGAASLEVVGWIYNSWRPMILQMRDGFLLWYEAIEAGKRGKLTGSMHLQDFALERGAEQVVRLRTDLATHSFKFASHGEAWEWIHALQVHAQHCVAVTQYLEGLKASQVEQNIHADIFKKQYGGA